MAAVFNRIFFLEGVSDRGWFETSVFNDPNTIVVEMTIRKDFGEFAMKKKIAIGGGLKYLSFSLLPGSNGLVSPPNLDGFLSFR